MGIPNRIREIAESNSMTIRGLSEKTGIKYRTIQNYLAGNRSVGSEFLTALSEQMEVSASWLLTGAGPTLLTKLHPNEYSKVGIESETESDFIPIPCYSVEASAGSGALVETKASIGQYAFNAQWIKRRNLDQRMLNVITVRGDSMEPELYGNPAER